MFKKIVIFYSGLMFVLMFVLMILLIVVKLEDIDQDKNIRIANNGFIKNKENLKISTNKNIYLEKEDVIIVFENLGNNKIAQNRNSSLVTKCRSNMGHNYELAFIEYKNNNDWVAIEPVGRCSDNCNETCSGNKEIKSKNRTLITWTQTIVQCDKEKTSISMAPSGSYRISSAAWDKNTSSYIRIHSNIFKISNISKK